MDKPGAAAAAPAGGGSQGGTVGAGDVTAGVAGARLSMVGRPALQSGRLLVAPATDDGGALSASVAKKLAALMRELGVPEHPLPTKTVCDLFEQVCRDSALSCSLYVNTPLAF